MLGPHFPQLDHLAELGDAVAHNLVLVVVRVAYYLPEEVSQRVLECLVLRVLAQLRQALELLKAHLLGRDQLDLREDVVHVLLLKPDGYLIDYLVCLELVVGLGESPEHLNEVRCQRILLQKKLDDVIGPLNELYMSGLDVEQDLKDLILMHPLNQLFRSKARALKRPIVLDDLVQVTNALDSTF